MKKNSIKKFTFLIILILMILLIYNLLHNITKGNNINTYTITGRSENFSFSNILSLFNINQEEYIISSSMGEELTQSKSYTINVKVKNRKEDSNYKIIYSNGIDSYNQELTDNCDVSFKLEKEGKNQLKIQIIKDEIIQGEWSKTIYYLKGYEKQFLDEFSNNGVGVHFKNGGSEKYEKSIPMLKLLGVKAVRADIAWSQIDDLKGNYNYDNYNEWINELKNENIDIIAILNPQIGQNAGTTKKIDNQEKFDNFMKFIKDFVNKFPSIDKFEVLNEPNYSNAYITDEEINWYKKMSIEIANIIKENNDHKEVILGSTATAMENGDKFLSSINFLNNIYSPINNYLYAYSFHPYDVSNIKVQNSNMYYKMNEHLNFFNDKGGFSKIYLTEYGISAYEGNKVTEDMQAQKNVQQSVILDQYQVKSKVLYNLWNTGTNLENKENNFGLLYNNYTPKPSYYAMKNYYENTNGAEYIGMLNIAEGLEAHVYDKDGKPKIVAWSNNTSKDIPISYEGFTAKDLYGNEIENTDGTLTITTSPVYLDNVEEKYFYQAISNTAIEKYAELEEKFAEQLQKVPEINQQIQSLKGQIEQIGKVENKIEEETAKTLMQRHFQLGNSLINAFQNGRLEIEKVKLSSMLDMLNDIGNSYEDLVTVTATTRNADINQAKDLVNEVENIIQSNSDIEIIYPEKILDFSKDFQEKAEYINGLEEENDIKTGLIVSKNLHSIYLSDWAKEFTNIYIDEYLKNNLIPETYSEKDITNQDVTVTLNIGNDTKIINNNGSNQYTFTENGEFTFEYVRRGRNFRQTVKVDNIDKQSPNITGVKQGQVYENTVKPIVEDDNLETIRLIQDGRLIENYINKTELTEEGVYRIEAEDKAGNKTIVNFEIIENISKDYIIKEEQIENIQVNTTVEEFRKKLQIESYYTIIRQEQTLNEKSIIQTGDILQLENGTQYPLIVRGDIDKDGKSTIRDLLLLKQHVNEESTLEYIQKIAGDIDLNGKLDARDVVKLRKLILTNNAP